MRRWVKLNGKLNFTAVTQNINTNKTNCVYTYYIISQAFVLSRRAWRSMGGWELEWASACLTVTLERCFPSPFRNISTQRDLQPLRQLDPVVCYVLSAFTTLGSKNTFSFLKQPYILCPTVLPSLDCTVFSSSGLSLQTVLNFLCSYCSSLNIG